MKADLEEARQVRKVQGKGREEGGVQGKGREEVAELEDARQVRGVCTACVSPP